MRLSNPNVFRDRSLTVDSYMQLNIHRTHTTLLCKLLEKKKPFITYPNRGTLLLANESTLFPLETTANEHNWKDEKNLG